MAAKTDLVLNQNWGGIHLLAVNTKVQHAFWIALHVTGKMVRRHVRLESSADNESSFKLESETRVGPQRHYA